MDLRFKGWACLDFVERQLRWAGGFNIAVIMVGGNDLQNGAMPRYFENYCARIEALARQTGIRSIDIYVTVAKNICTI